MMTEFSIRIADWKTDIEQLIGLRTQVFVEEQKVPADLELDEMDVQSLHIKACLDDATVVGTARLLPSHYIGRMCVSRDHRKMGIGGAMLEFFIRYAQQRGIAELHLNAQLSALKFYQRYGFVENSDIFMEAGIPHIHMSKKL
jgi:predicted GNAT family N-acyltransferase